MNRKINSFHPFEFPSNRVIKPAHYNKYLFLYWPLFNDYTVLDFSIRYILGSILESNVND